MYINLNGNGANIQKAEVNPRKDVQNNNNNIAKNAYANANQTQTSGQVSISQTYGQLQNVESQLKKADTVNRKKVEELKLAIKEGKFQINEEAIADKLLSTVKEFLLNSSAKGNKKG